MIFLKLLFVAYSFDFQSEFKRTPYLANLTSDTVFVETEKSGLYQFELCQLTTTPSRLFEDLNKSDVKCKPLTQQIQFTKENDHQVFFEKFVRSVRSELKVRKLMVTGKKVVVGWLMLRSLPIILPMYADFLGRYATKIHG